MLFCNRRTFEKGKIDDVLLLSMCYGDVTYSFPILFIAAVRELDRCRYFPKRPLLFANIPIECQIFLTGQEQFPWPSPQYLRLPCWPLPRR